MIEIFISFGFFALAALWFRTLIKIRNTEYDKMKSRFIELEQAANNVRKKNIDEKYFYIPNIDKYPVKNYDGLDIDSEYANIAKKQDAIIKKSTNKMIKFSPSKSNLEIKNEFGVSNLSIIAGYEENFDRFMSLLTDWASELKKHGFLSDAEIILKNAIEDGCDTSGAFILLADLYRGDTKKIDDFREFIKKSGFMRKDRLLSYLSEKVE